MNIYKKMLEKIYYIGSIIVPVLVVLIQDSLEAWNIGKPIVIYVFSTLFGVIAFVLIVSIFNFIVKRCKRIRVIFLRESYVEGFWLDYTLNRKDEITGGGIIRIKIEDGDLKIFGENYALDIAHKRCLSVGDFKSTMSNIEAGSLEFSYFSNNRPDNKSFPGYAKYRFPSTGDVPVMFQSYFSGVSTEVVQGIGEKVVDKERIDTIKYGNLVSKEKLVFDFLTDKINKRGIQLDIEYENSINKSLI